MKLAATIPRTPGRAFTLIEIMVVVAIMGLIVAMGIPSIYHLTHKEGLYADLDALERACRNARRAAIFSGTTTEVVFHPMDRHFESSGVSGQIDDSVTLEMLDINMLEYKDSEWAKVYFHPNGTSDEMTVILHSDKNEWKKLTLEPTTGLTTIGAVDR